MKRPYSPGSLKNANSGTAACPPYHLAVVIGGTSAEQCVETAKLASARYLDSLPTSGDATGHAFRDLELEQNAIAIAANRNWCTIRW